MPRGNKLATLALGNFTLGNFTLGFALGTFTRGRSSVRYGTRLGDLKNKHSTHTHARARARACTHTLYGATQSPQIGLIVTCNIGR